MLPVDHVAHLTRINKEGLALLLLVARNEPQGHGNRHTVKEFVRERNDPLHQIRFDDLAANLPLAAGLRGKRTVRQHETNLPVRFQM